MTKQNLGPGRYVRLAPDDEKRIERHRKEMERDAAGTITASDAMRDLIRRGIDATDANVASQAGTAMRAVPGAPFQPEDIVSVVGAIDEDIHDVSAYIGKSGSVAYLEYECGCGQAYPHDPMIGVTFEDGTTEEFWREELES